MANERLAVIWGKVLKSLLENKRGSLVKREKHLLMTLHPHLFLILLPR